MVGSEADYVVALTAVPGIGLKTLRKSISFIKHHHLSWSELWSSTSWWAEVGLRADQQQALKLFQQHYTPQLYREYLASRSITVVTETDTNYPQLLRECPDRPLVLFVKGPGLQATTVPLAVVGTRAMTAYGELATEHLVGPLSTYHTTIISGFMRGIDVKAHLVALEHKAPTLGVLGYGFDHLFPADQRSLFSEMLAAGQTFITEYAPSTAPSKGGFLQRNRIIAGMSWGTLVIEAGVRSGSHVTADYANNYGRSVFAVPGPLTNPFSEGTKALINQGARLVTTAADIIDDLADTVPAWHHYRQLPSNSSHAPIVTDNLSSLEEKIVAALLAMPQSTDQLLQRGFDLTRLQLALTQLEVKRLIVKKRELWLIKPG